MTREHDLELFVLKNAVITQDLRSTLVAQRVGNTRGMLEAQADSLVAEYLRQVDFETLADAERMSVVKENWEVFSGMFSNATRNRVLRVINRLNLVRGPIAHCNLLPEEEAIRLRLAIRDWYKLME